MKYMKKEIRIFLLLCAIPILGLGYWVFGIVSEAQTVTIFSKIQDSQPPLKVDEVVKLLGSPSHIDESETTGLKGEVYYYPWHSNEMKIVFVNDTVFQAEYTADKKS